MRRFITRLTASARDSRSGVAAVEFAIIAPVLIILLAGATNVGLAVDHSIQLANAARAGAQYATVQQNDMAGAQAAALRMMPPEAIVATPVMSCFCPPAGSATGTTEVVCTTTCATGMARYITITVSMAPTQIPGLAFFSSADASRTVVARVQ